MTGYSQQAEFRISGYPGPGRVSFLDIPAGFSGSQSIDFAEPASSQDEYLFRQVVLESPLDDLFSNSFDKGSRFTSPPTEYTSSMSTGGYMERQVDQFMGQLDALLEQYEGRYIAFEDGVILASGNDFWQVVDQVNEQRGSVRPMFVERVQREYPPIEM